ncbi:MAG: DUF721 domain-containing protein [Nitrosospira sp.]|nr:DUF721 domain-containing protein [Nitrosospira sp.]
MSARKINFYLGSLRLTPEHQRLFNYADKLALMQQVFVKIAPPRLAQRCTVGAFVEGALTLCADNGAIAAKLRQTLPSLLLKFQATGYEVTSIKVAVQARYKLIDSNRESVKRRRIGSAGLANLNNLATELPQSPLKNAIRSLLKRQTRGEE